MKRFRWLSVAIFFIVVCSLLPLASTGTVQADSGKGNLKELTDAADSVLVGTVTDRSSYWNDAHTQIYTSVAFSIQDRLKGATGLDSVTITVPGGKAEGIGEWVSDAPSFDQGEQAVVFLKKLSNARLPQAEALPAIFSGEQFEVYQGFRGKFPIKGARAGGLPLVEFKGRVNNILGGQTLPAAQLDVTTPPVTMPYLVLPYSWHHPPSPVVPYRINENATSCTGEGAAAQSGAATWAAAGANFSFSYAGTTTATAPALDGVNEIIWVNMGNVSTLALTNVWYDQNNNIVECDTEFNDYYNWNTSPTCPPGDYDVQSVGLHELGHWVGLDDLYGYGDTDKVMYGYGYAGQTKRALTADDIAGIQSIYGIYTPLSIITTTLPDGAVGVPYSQTLQASGGTGSYTWSITSGSLSAGLTLTPSTGVIAGTPTTTGTSNFIAQVNDGSTTASQALSITVTVPLQKLLGANDAASGVPAGASYLLMDRFAAVATGNVTQIRVKCTNAGSVKVALYTDSTGSPGTLINANNTGASVIAGWNNINIPSTAVTSGTYYWIAYNSSLNCVGNSAFTGGAVIYRALSYSNDFPASAGTGFATYSGYHSLVAGWGVAGPIPLSITTTSLPDGAVGVAYSQTLQASGGTGSYTWSITSGSLPAGLTLTPSTGVITGTPTTNEASNFTAQVNDGSTTASQALSITVTVPLQKLLGADNAAGTGDHGYGYFVLHRYQAVAIGNMTKFQLRCGYSGNIKVAVYADNAGAPGALITAMNTGQAVSPGWVSVNFTSTSIVSGNYYWLGWVCDGNNVRYTDVGTGVRRYKLATYSTFTFPDPAGSGFTSDTYGAITAGWGVAGPIPLSITTTSLPDSAVGVPYSQTLQASGGTGTYTWSITSGSLPAGLTLTAGTGIISGTPTTAALYNFTVQVNDGSTTASQALSITVTVPLQKLLGADDAVAIGPVGASYLLMDRFAAVATGNVTQIRVKCTTAGSVKVALYTDSTGSPGTLINANNTGASVIAGWNNISIPSTAVTLGTNYWIAFNSSVNCVGHAAFPGGAILYRGFSYSTDFPASAGAGFAIYSGYNCLVAGWGVVTPPTLPDPPSLLSPGTAITFKWGASTGATTYWLQVNTASDFTGTNLFNAEVGNVTSQEVTGLSLGTAYYWRVKAGNSGGWSAWSSVRSVVTSTVP